MAFHFIRVTVSFFSVSGFISFGWRFIWVAVSFHSGGLLLNAVSHWFFILKCKTRNNIVQHAIGHYLASYIAIPKLCITGIKTFLNYIFNIIAASFMH